MEKVGLDREVAWSPRSAEARRKRIAERSSDRLAFITGQIQSLPPAPPPPPPGSPVASPRLHINRGANSLPLDFSQQFSSLGDHFIYFFFSSSNFIKVAS